MNETKLTVLFEEPFWVGIFERTENEKLSVSKITFGAEPTDAEVYEFILSAFKKLKFSPPVDVKPRHEITNPKRALRVARKQTVPSGVGTKSQQALSLQHEMMKDERKKTARDKKDELKKQQFELKQQKKKEKHKGR